MKSFAEYIKENANGIPHMDVVLANGDEFVDMLLTHDVLITVKVDSAALVVMNDDGYLKFFGRGGQNEIDATQRASMDLYKKPIEFIQSKDWKQLPSGVKFYLEMFDSHLPKIINYQTQPKNDLVMLFAQDADGNRLDADDPIVQEATETLDVTPPPILYSGELTDKMKREVKNFINMKDDLRQTTYCEPSCFREFVYSLFNLPDPSRWSVDSGLEGLVFTFRGDDIGSVVYKLIDPSFTAKLRQKDFSRRDLREYKKQLALDTWDIIDDLGYENINVLLSNIEDSEDKDRQYIQFISALTMHVASKIDQGKYSPMESMVKANRFYNLDKDLVGDDVYNLSQISFFVQDVYQILSRNFSSQKKRTNPSSGLTQQAKEIVNTINQALQDKGIR